MSCANLTSFSDTCKFYTENILKIIHLPRIFLQGTKKPRFKRGFRGSKRIRTAVNGFADRYLTTRTWNQYL